MRCLSGIFTLLICNAYAADSESLRRGKWTEHADRPESPPQKFRDDLDVHAFLKKPGGVGVPERVNADFLDPRGLAHEPQRRLEIPGFHR